MLESGSRDGAEANGSARRQSVGRRVPRLEDGRLLRGQGRFVDDVDLVVHFVKAHGGTRPKVFKLAHVTLAPRESVSLRKTVSLADLTTRRHYPGRHPVALQLNGAAEPLGAFTLIR